MSAIEIASADVRRAYLDQACGRAGPLRRAVDHLLGAHESPQGLLDLPDEACLAREPSAPPANGTQIGPYKIGEQIGEGGMGKVYVAEQTEPVRRKVALNIIRPGLATKDVVARFEAERQALAMMDHPNSARVFDGGTTGGDQ